MHHTAAIVGIAEHVERAQVVVVEQLVELVAGASHAPHHDLTRPETRVEDVVRRRLRSLLVEAGQAADFSAMTPHAIAGDGAPVEILTIFDRDGEHAHLRPARPAAAESRQS